MDTGNTSNVRVRATNLAASFATSGASEASGRSAGERMQARSQAINQVREAAPPATLEGKVAAAVGQSTFDRFLKGQATFSMVEGTLDVVVPTTVLLNLVERRFADQLKQVAQREAPGRSVHVRYRVDRAAFEGDAPPMPRATVLPVTLPASSNVAVTPIKYRFDSFIVGRANRLACSAAQRIAEDDGPVPMLFIHGSCGLGKTHLLRAAAARFQERRPGSMVRYTTAEAFTNEFIMAIRTGKTDQFRKNYRKVDFLCLDDVHFFARTNKDSTQNELMNTLDTAGLDGARIIVASDEHPKEITKLSDRLVSRFMAGAVVKIEPPDAELRGRLIRHLAQKRSLPLDDEAATLLAERSGRSAGSLGGFGGSVREMEGLLNQVDAVHRLLPEYGLGTGAITAALVRKALGIDQQQEAPAPASTTMRVRRPMNAESIVAEVCRELAVDLNDFMGKGRHKRVVLARSLVASLSRRLTTMSFPEIARAMGRSNHSTIITAQKRIDRQIADDVGRPLSAELAAGHAGRTLRELNDHLFRTLQRV